MTVNPPQDLTTASIRTQKLLDRIPYLAWLMAENGEMYRVNHRWCEELGRCDWGKAGSRSLFTDFLQIEERDRLTIGWELAKAAQQPLQIKLRLKNSLCGDWEWFQVELEPDTDEFGQTIWIGTAMRLGDTVAIADRQQAIAALERSERRFRAIFDGAFQFIGLTQTDGTIIEANLTALKFGGIEAHQAIGRKFWEVSGWKFSPAVRRKLRAATVRAARGEFVRFEVELTGAGDLTIPIDFSLTPMRNELGEVTMLIPEARDLSYIKQVESERAHAERYLDRLSTALKVAKAGAWSWDLSADRLYWTPEFEILFDYEPGSTQQIYSEWLARVHPDDRQPTEAVIMATIDGTAAPEYRREYRIVDRQGRIRWIDAIGEVYTDDLGKRWLSGLVYDITDRKRDEEALRRSEEFTRRILASSQDCIKVLDLDGRLLLMNDGGQGLMEIDDFTTVANSQWSNFWQGNANNPALAALEAAKTGAFGKFEGYCPTAKGTPKWWEVATSPILDANGNVEKILAVSRDITERHQSAIALQASERMFRHTFEQNPVGLAHVRLDGQLFRVNQKFCEIIGYSQVELLTTTFHQITEPDDLATDLALVDRLLNNEFQEYTLEKRYIHKQGHRIWVNLTVSLARELTTDGSLGAPQYFLAAVKDITERKELELRDRQQTIALQQLNSSLIFTQQRLKERNEQLDRFVSVASHDLKAPLRSVANLAQWIEDDFNEELPAGAQAQFQRLRQRVNRMSALVEGLLQYSRVGREELPTQPVDLDRLLTETIDSLAPPPHFEIDIAEPLPTLQTNRVLIHQVFANLIGNAIKHNNRAERGRIQITAVDLADRYQFSISDNGPGIPPEAHERIFEIFQTLQPSTSSENTGIGLAIVKKIIEGQGGKIWLDETTTQGACFCFTWFKEDPVGRVS